MVLTPRARAFSPEPRPPPPQREEEGQSSELPTEASGSQEPPKPAKEIVGLHWAQQLGPVPLDSLYSMGGHVWRSKPPNDGVHGEKAWKEINKSLPIDVVQQYALQHPPEKCYEGQHKL